MLLQKKGFPEEDELVMCTVLKVQYHSVLVGLDEYGKNGMIHISEVSPGRIRNIRDFVKEGKKVVCKVLKVNHEKGYIDLSLRRVTEIQKREKVDEIKQEQKAEKIIEFVAKELNVDIKKLFDDIVPAVIKKNILVYEFFQHVAKDSALLKDTKLDAKAAAALEEAIKFRIKEASVKIEGKLKLSSFAANGIDIIKEAIKRAIEVKKENVLIKYLGAGVYSINVKASDYKAAEKIMEGAVEKALSHVKENEGEGNFVRMGA